MIVKPGTAAAMVDRAFRELNAVQLAVLRIMLRVKLVGLMLPRQVGKTHFGVWCIREIMRQNSNAQTMFLAKDFPSIKRNTQEKFLKLFPEEEFNVTTQGVMHPRPSQHEQRGSAFLSGVDKNPHKIRGGTMAFVHWSEVAFSKFEGGQSFQTIHETVVLPTISRTMGYYLLESTPLGSNFWKQWWEADNGFAKIRFELELCIQLGAITREQADYMERSMHPDVFKQEMLCLFVSFQGKVYAEYSERHKKQVDVEPHEKVIVGIDVGHTAAFSALIGRWRTQKNASGDERKRLGVVSQVYQSGLRIGQMVDLLQQRLLFLRVDPKSVVCYTDHDPEMVEELRARGLRVELADKTDPFACRLAIKEALHFGDLEVNPATCAPLDKEMDAATWSETKADEMEERGDPNGHHWDSEASLRYLFRGSKLELEKPEETPAHVLADSGEQAEWKAREARRAAKREKAKHPMPTRWES